MAWDYKDVLLHQGQRLETERAEAVAMLEQARLNEDVTLLDHASDQILRLDRDSAQLMQYANNYTAQVNRQQQQQQRNPSGLTYAEREVAHSHPDRNMSNAQKEQLYAHNKARYWQARRDGSYRDDQGTVRR